MSAETHLHDTTDEAPRPPRALAPLLRQFGRPQGILGRVAALLMVRRNTDLNRGVVESLDLGPGDWLLDIGCGVGLGVEAALGRGAHVSGVDVSPLMVELASKRNAAAIRAGSADIREAGVDALPYDAAVMTQALSINSLTFWPSTASGLAEVRRVLGPGGSFAIVLRLKDPHAHARDPRAYGSSEAELDDIEAALAESGFVDTTSRVETYSGEPHKIFITRYPSRDADQV